MSLKNLGLYVVLLLSLSCTSEVPPEVVPDGYPYYAQAFDYLENGKPDSAFFVFDMAKDIFIEAQDSLNAANCLIQMAITLHEQGDHFGAQETGLSALEYLDAKNPAHYAYISSNFNNLGNATSQLKDFERAIAFYDSAIQYSGDSSEVSIYLNNKAIAFFDSGRYGKALEIYERIIRQSHRDRREYARALTNYSNTRWRLDTAYDAAPHLLEALRIREEQDDYWGQNSSYAHLAEYYEQRRPDAALHYARKRYAVANKLRSAEDQIKALHRLIKLSPVDSVKGYFAVYRRLADSLQLARATAKNQFALIRYEVEKSKADNLRLQKENAEKAYQIARQRIWTGTAIAFALALFVGGTFWYRKREQRLALEAQHRIKAHKLQTSKKIHDVVANGLYRVMAEIENREEIDREGILDRLEGMYEQSRDISYETEEPAEPQQDDHELIAGLLKAFSTDSVKIIIAGNSPELWEGLPSSMTADIRHVLQELMVNMRKHSQATDVVVRFEKTSDRLQIVYSDNGIGLPESFTKGNGLTNTGSRIERLRGQLTFASEGGKGLKIEVVLPVSKN